MAETMKISDLEDRLPHEAADAIRSRGISELTPPQELSVEHGLLEGKNLVISAPTASGKTLIAELAMLRSVIADRRKALYIAPMRALVSEKYSEFKESYPQLKVAMSIGDVDSLDTWLEGYDIILVSTEKLDSLIRHGVGWLDSVGCLVFDEIHMLDDPKRGPTLEILAARMKRTCTHAQIVALSATIGNSKELADWLGAELVESEYRPVVLEKGIEFEGEVTYNTDRSEKLESDSKMAEMRITEDTLEKGKQLLLFYSTKRNAEAGADKLSRAVGRRLTVGEKATLRVISEQVLGVLGKPTLQCEKLSKAILNGVAFHHSGLVNEQRHIVEEAFRKGEIKAICSTTTLGLGVNLPAHTVVVRDTTRYGEMEGSEKLGVNEVVQLFGRAGRPKYDKSGRALLIAKHRAEVRELYDRYIDAELQPVTSKLSMLPVLRTHVLAFIATKFLTTEESILDFLSGTLYGYQYSNMYEVKENLRDILGEFVAWGFIEKGNSSVYRATRIGMRVSELYIDPLSAKWLIDVLPSANDDLSVLFMICNTIEMRPHVKTVERAIEMFPQYQNMLQHASSNYESDEAIFYDPLRAFSSATMLLDWISEKTEPEITNEYNTTPGALFTKITNADWLLYSCSELAKLLRVSPIRLIEMRLRTRYGIRRELLDLIRLEQVGRVRARLMYLNGIKGVSDLRKPGAQETVERLFGKEIAKKIMDQLDRN
ncbi:MAG: DEAD/DEAH box helicase [Candidatus Micrarchaeota archaeon]|nr:DEAD/DEAH box helicase [Candidatus Micrarchaeota archaeon]